MRTVPPGKTWERSAIYDAQAPSERALRQGEEKLIELQEATIRAQIETLISDPSEPN